MIKAKKIEDRLKTIKGLAIKNSWIGFILIIVLIILIWKPLLVFFIPGMLILFVPCFKKTSLIEVLIYAIGLSLAFWICSFWFLKYIPLSLTTFFWLISIATIISSAYFFYKKRIAYNISFSYENFILLALFIFVGILRFLPMFQAITPSGADMSMHTYITNLILHADGIPANYHPILGIEKFNSFPVGFHTVSALISVLGNIPEYRATFIMSCLTYVLLTAFLFVFLRKFVSWKFAFISAISFTFFASNPQGFTGWGGNPTIFALALFILFISFFNKLEENNSKWLILFSSVSLASVLLSHTIIFVQAFYIFGFSFFVYFLLKKDYKNFSWIKYLWIILIFLIIAAPYFINFNYSITTPETQSWIKNWVTNTNHVWHGTAQNFLWTIPLYIINYTIGSGIFRYFLIICLFGLICMLFKNKKLGILYAFFSVWCVLLILNTKYWLLPFSYAIYPERVATMIIIPLSLFFAYFLETSFRYIKNKRWLDKYFLLDGLIVLMILMIILIPIFNNNQYVKGIIIYSSVTSSDIEAFNWLKENTISDDVIMNNYGDAGLWIPSILFRPVTNTHVNVVYLDKLKPLDEPKYVYIGKKCVYDCSLKKETFSGNDKYQLIYSKDGVYIYKIIK